MPDVGKQLGAFQIENKLAYHLQMMTYKIDQF